MGSLIVESCLTEVSPLILSHTESVLCRLPWESKVSANDTNIIIIFTIFYTGLICCVVVDEFNVASVFFTLKAHSVTKAQVWTEQIELAKVRSFSITETMWRANYLFHYWLGALQQCHWAKGTIMAGTPVSKKGKNCWWFSRPVGVILK